MKDAYSAALARWFGFDGLRPPQVEAVTAFAQGRDALVVLPTGSGKSLCYQLPAVVEGPMLVVSPLIALMEDQVSALRSRGIEAAVVHSGMPYRERDAVRARTDWALIYASPERVKVKRFRRWLQACGVKKAAIDEAHCITEWGHDFRKDYRTLDVLKDELGMQVMALTATATARVRDDIVASLNLHEPVRVTADFRRPNLVMSVEHIPGHKARLARTEALIREHLGEGRAVVYAASRKRAKKVGDALRKAGLPAGHYHAGRTDSARANAQEKFATGERRVMVATTAFGMGIDHPDVRLVVHVEAPGTLESWYQQAGRAGRDGETAHCVLLYSDADAVVHARIRGEDAHPGAVQGWKDLQDFVYGVTCREVEVARHFGGQRVPPCGRCDVCRNAKGVAMGVMASRERSRSRARARDQKRRADDAVMLTPEQLDRIVSFVGHLKKPVGKTMVAMGLRGSRAKKAKRVANNPDHGTLKDIPERSLVRAIEELLAEGRLARKGKKYPTVWLPDKRVRPKKPAGAPKARPKGLTKALKDFRKREARRRRWRAYQVFTNATLAGIVAARPTTLQALQAVPGMGPKRVSRFGEGILALVAEYPSKKQG